MFGLTFAQIWALIVRAKRITAMSSRIADALNSDPTLVKELTEIFSDPAAGGAHDEPMAKQKVTATLRQTQQDLDAADRATERDGN